MSNQNVHIDFDSIDEEVEILEPTTEVEHADEEVSESALSPELLAQLNHHRQQTLNYVDHRMTTVNETLKQHSSLIESSVGRINQLEQTVATQAEMIAKMATGQLTVSDIKTVQSGEEEDNRGIIDTTLGTVGNVAHGIIDTAAFLCESIIDLATLGKAKKAR